MEKIVVSIRVRPLNKQEASKGSPWKISSNAISLCNASAGTVLSGQTYVFDSVFGTEEKTLDLYNAHTKPIISSAVKGINGTVFAYGQTSSGKTFTMRGCPQEPGIIPLSVHDVFANIQQAEDREFLLRVSYMEIYNEEINDLLVPENRKLQVHENLERGIFVAGLREEIVSCPEQVLQLLEFGEAHRHVGETNMNVYSSRSHTIFRMVIESRDRSQDNALQACDAVRVSVLNLVDLAGSERVAKTGAEGARLKEGSHINKSLMTLGTVINKLSEGIESQGGHVPYRDSKLTRILQPALGGNARTVIICNITPAMVHVDESKGTLQFASRAIRVTNCAQVNEIVTDGALLKRQKREIEELRNKLQESHSEHLEEEILNLRNAMLKIELERERMALELQNKAERELRMKEQIENLSTMVLNSAVDDRHTDKSVKKTNRRETWCPRLTSSKRAIEVQSLRTPSLSASLVSHSRERTLPLPPSFEALKEEDDAVMESDVPGEDGRNKDIFVPPAASCFVGNRRHKFSARLHATEEELLDLQARYQALHCDYEVATSEIDKLRNENEQLKATAYKAATKQNDGDRRCKSLDGNTDAPAEVITELQSQVQNLEIEKYYMQRELDSRIEHAKSQTTSAKQVLEGLYEELKESNQQIELLTTRSMQLEQQKDEATRSYVQLATAFEDLNAEVELTMSHATGWIQSLLLDTKEPIISLENVRKSFFSEVFNSYGNLTIEKTALEHKLALTEAGNHAAVLEATKKAEVAHEDECQSLILEIQALQKDLASAKALPSSLEREKEGMRKELEKSKAKMKDIEAKLKTTLQDKSKLEAEKANLDRELRTLRGQSTLLQRDIDKRESLADKRRESMACFNKTKHQLSFAENALQQKSLDLEKTSFELQVLQGAYDEVEASLLESKNTIDLLQKQVATAEDDISRLKEERDKAVVSANIMSSELQDATKQSEASTLLLNELQQARDSLSRQLEERNASMQMQESLAEELVKAKQDLVMELTDVYYKLEEEKAISNSRRGLIEEKESECSALKDKIKTITSEKLTQLEALEQITSLKITKLEEAFEERKCQLDAAVETFGAELEVIMQKASKVEDGFQKEIQNRVHNGQIMQELRASKLELEEQIEDYKQQTTELECMNQKTEEALENLKELLKNTNETCNSYKETIEKLTHELNCEHEKLEKLQEELSQEKDHSLQNAQRTLTFELRQKELDAMVQTSEKENRNLLASKFKLEVGCEALAAKADVFEGRLLDARWHLIEFKDRAKITQDELESNLTAARLEIVELKVELGNAKDQLSERIQQAQTSKLKKLKDIEQEGIPRVIPRGKPSKDHRRSPLSQIDNCPAIEKSIASDH